MKVWVVRFLVLTATLFTLLVLTLLVFGMMTEPGTGVDPAPFEGSMR